MKDSLKKIYGVDASRLKGLPSEVEQPETIEEARNIIAISKRIIPRGGATGLAGGCVPITNSDTVLDLSKLDKILDLDEEQKIIIVEAGVILDDLQEHLKEYNLEFPVKPSSHMACTIGGMIAADAVGNRAIKYGKTSSWIKWVEIIDGNGSLHKKGITEISDYAGLEGITGVISKACLKLSPLKQRTASLIALETTQEIIETVRDKKRNTSVSAIEFLDKTISEKIGLEPKYNLIIEYENDSGELKEKYYEELMQKRDAAYPIIAKEGYTRIEDPKLMLDKIPTLITWLEKAKVPVFGHIGVGILHPCFNTAQEKHIPEMMKLVKRLGGAISGEHGIGVLKKAFVEFNDKKILENIKKRTDTLNKFNVGKVI